MISIGNDIINLQLINPERTKQEKFYSKIICKSELRLFQNNNFNTLSFENFVWLAWSVKESVYKFYKRNNHHTLFSPTKIIIQQIDLPIKQKPLNFYKQHEGISFCEEECYCCQVSFKEIIFYTRSFVYDEMIFTVANNTNCFDNIYWGIKTIDDDAYTSQSKSVRAFSLKKLSSFFKNINLSIGKSEAGYPVLMQQKNLPISFTHHGNFIGYAFLLTA